MEGKSEDSKGPQFLIRKRKADAYVPFKASRRAAGYDLTSYYDYEIPPHGKELIHTEIEVALPEGTYGRIAPRSSLAWKFHIDVGAGVIDSDYRGEIGIVLFNHSDTPFKIQKGDRVAQLIIERIENEEELKIVEDLESTERGENGFGSTGAKSKPDVVE